MVAHKTGSLASDETFVDAIQQMGPEMENLGPEKRKKIAAVRKKVFSKYSGLFRPENIQGLTKAEYTEFLKYRYNRASPGLYRAGGKVVNDMRRLRRALSILVDGRHELVGRIDKILPKGGDPFIKTFGRAQLTTVLHFRDPKGYGIFNGATEGAVRDLKLTPHYVRGMSFGEKYVLFNRTLLRLARELNVDLWTLQWMWQKNSASKMTKLLFETEKRIDDWGEFDPKSKKEGRDRALQDVTRRRGQPQFRKQLLDHYGGKCAITACDAVEALEAAHITPYRGKSTNNPANGILLRADVHTLFDLYLVSVNPSTLEVAIAPELDVTSYKDMEGTKVHLPIDEKARPSKAALEEHWKKFTL